MEEPNYKAILEELINDLYYADHMRDVRRARMEACEKSGIPFRDEE